MPRAPIRRVGAFFGAPRTPPERETGSFGLTPADRQRRYRDCRRRGVRVYLVEFPDVALAALLDAGELGDADALDAGKVARLIARLASKKP